MIGQGSPYAPFAASPAASRRQAPSRTRTVAVCLLAVLCACALCAPTAWCDEIDFRLRVTWGNGAARAWKGSVTATAGQISDPRRLGLETNLPGALVREESGLRIWERSPTTFDGVDFTIRAPVDTTLTLTFQPASGSGSAGQSFEIPLARFRDDVAFSFRQALDARGNRLLVRRAPGDRLRVHLKRESLIFAAGEEFAFEVTPHELAMPEGKALRCQFELVDGDGGVPWRDSRNFTWDGRRDQAPFPVRLQLPEREGVYTFVISLFERTFTDNFVPSPLRKPKLLMQRKMQIVVLAHRPPDAAETTLEEVGQIELGDPVWWGRWNWIPQLPGMPRFPQEPLGSASLETEEHGGRTLHRMGPGDWHAAPIPIAAPGRPHVLEIEYPNDEPQTLGISILEQNAESEARPLFLDSGIHVPRYPPSASLAMETHRIVFWPRTRTPWLLLTNRGQEQPARAGRITVRAAPESLPGEAVPRPSGEARLVAAYYDKPFFPQNFQAPEAWEQDTGRSLNDWNTYYLGGTRLIEYLRYAGYNAAMISVLRDGGALYPSALLDAIPRHDNGTYFISGQDPVPKDVLEMLFRLFDRAGMRLIPALHFTAPLPELESLPDAHDASAGVQLVDHRRVPWSRYPAARNGGGPFYNPLEPRVQTAVRRVLDELADRYAHHPSFAGIALQLGSQTYVQLPDENWAQDRRTLGRFSKDIKVALNDDATTTRFLSREGREPWLDWRAARLADFYASLQKSIRRRRGDARLFLAGADLAASQPVVQEMQPQFLARPNFEDAMRRQGLDAGQLRQSGVVLLRPKRLAPVTSLPAQATNIALNGAKQVDRFFASSRSGLISFHEPKRLRVGGFEAVSPFGPERTTALLFAHIPPAGMHNRARFVKQLAAGDAQLLVDGGWMLPLGQEDAVRELLVTFAQLPAGPFETLEPAEPGADAGLVVRAHREPGRTFLYLLNESPWPLEAQLQLDAPPRTTLRSLGPRALPQPQRNGSRLKWTVPLRPYDLVAAVFRGELDVPDWKVHVPGDVELQLAEQAKEVRDRIYSLAGAKPMAALENPGFEKESSGDGIPGWRAPDRPGVVAEVVADDPHRGARSLHLQVRQPNETVWVQSAPFPLPRSGRIKVEAFVRTADPQQQPPLRVYIDLLQDGRDVSYLYQSFGVDVDDQVPARPTGRRAIPLPGSWPEQPFSIHSHNLPVTNANQVAIQFALMGEGEVWIDDVRVSDLHFAETEQEVLLRNAANAKFLLDAGRLTACQHYLSSYWPQYLREFAPPPDLRTTALPARPAAPPAAPRASETKKSRFPLLPRWPFNNSGSGEPAAPSDEP